MLTGLRYFHAHLKPNAGTVTLEIDTTYAGKVINVEANERSL